MPLVIYRSMKHTTLTMTGAFGPTTYFPLLAMRTRLFATMRRQGCERLQPEMSEIQIHGGWTYTRQYTKNTAIHIRHNNASQFQVTNLITVMGIISISGLDNYMPRLRGTKIKHQDEMKQTRQGNLPDGPTMKNPLQNETCRRRHPNWNQECTPSFFATNQTHLLQKMRGESTWPCPTAQVWVSVNVFALRRVGVCVYERLLCVCNSAVH